MILSLMTLVTLAACSNAEAELRPVEEEQIENVVKEFVTRDTNIPDYEVTIEEATDSWARVSLKPEQVEGPATFLYLHKQAAEDAPTVETNVQPGNDARVETTSGWSIVLGPQAQFSDAELNEAGVPEAIR